MDKFVIIDGNNLMFRAFYALPQLSNFDGEISNAVFGFTNMLVKIIKDVSPKYIAVAFDVGKTFRHEKYPEYKGTRKPMPDELRSQFPIMKDLLKKMNITIVEHEGLEADDMMGCLSRMFKTSNIIVSADRDVFQLINDNTVVCFPKRGVSDTITLDKNNLKDFYGVNPEQVIDLKSLMGDSSDNIPGVSGVGEKRALQLITDYQTLDGVYENLDKLTGKLKENLVSSKENAYLSKYLATIVTDKVLPFELSDFQYDFPFNKDVLDVFKRYQFNILLKREDLFKTDIDIVPVSTQSETINDEQGLKALVSKIQSKKQMAIFIDQENFDIFVDISYKINTSKDLFTMGVGLDRALEILKPVLEDENIKKTVFDSKALKHILYNFGVGLNGVKFDCILARYLINSIAKTNVTIKEVLYECGLESTDYAYSLNLIKDRYYAKLESMGLLKLYYDIEMPLVDVLFDMEITGFKLDREELAEMEGRYREELSRLEESIYLLSGKHFNISSPKQLAEVLFEDLALPCERNKKKSTSIEILNELVDYHPVVPLIIRFRTISKLYSTYILGFENILDSSDKVHTIFNQALTATGRLSSSEPNLQNIPVRTEEGRSLRKAFISSFDGGLICSADYSQIELRLLASFSGDESMIKSFNDGQDIHARTASEIFGIPIDMVDSVKRRDAKAINFGIVYGISDFGLSQNIGISRKEAGVYIKKYFERYPKIESYMKNNVQIAKENGYVKTLFGRIRPIPEISSTNYNVRNFGERVAMNMPLQGSASDIIKLAMIRIFSEFNSRYLKSKIIVQVHDELVVDVYPGELETVKEILRTGMENVVNLSVKLTVNIECGKTWYEAK